MEWLLLFWEKPWKTLLELARERHIGACSKGGSKIGWVVGSCCQSLPAAHRPGHLIPLSQLFPWIWVWVLVCLAKSGIPETSNSVLCNLMMLLPYSRGSLLIFLNEKRDHLISLGVFNKGKDVFHFLLYLVFEIHFINFYISNHAWYKCLSRINTCSSFLLSHLVPIKS